MSKKAVVQIQVVGETAAHEPTVDAILLKGSLIEGMEAVWEGVIIVIMSLQTLDGERVQEFTASNQLVTIGITISNPSTLQRLVDQRLIFSSEQSIPVIDRIHPWQIEPTV